MKQWGNIYHTQNVYTSWQIKKKKFSLAIFKTQQEHINCTKHRNNMYKCRWYVSYFFASYLFKHELNSWPVCNKSLVWPWVHCGFLTQQFCHGWQHIFCPRSWWLISDVLWLHKCVLHEPCQGLLEQSSYKKKQKNKIYC